MTERTSDDPILDESFAVLRERDRERTPSIEAVLGRARAEARAGDQVGALRPRAVRHGRSRLHRWAVPALSGAIAAAAATVLLLRSGGVSEADFDQIVEAWVETGGTWQSPTDELLRLPGDELLRTVPHVGGVRSIPPTRDASPPDGTGLESL